MAWTILEELGDIEAQLRSSISVATIAHELARRAEDVRILLEKGWPVYQDMKILLAQYGSASNVPDCPVAPLPVPDWEPQLGRTSEVEEETAAESGPCLLSTLKVIGVTERGVEKIFRGECGDHRMYGFLTVEVCAVRSEFRHDEAMICVMLTDYPDRENDLLGEPLLIFDTVTLSVGERMTMMIPVNDQQVHTDGEGRLGWPVRIRVP